MKYVTYADNRNDLGYIKESGLDEVILSCSEFSRFATSENFNDLAKEAKELGLKVIFEWDILLVQNDFSLIEKKFSSLINIDLIDVIRVQDAGVLEWVLKHTDKPLQFIAETGNHNLVGLKKWKNYIGDRLDRMVLSIELSKEKLIEYKKELDCPLEILTVGPILLFYSPRKLLSPVALEKEAKNYFALADSEESPHKGFPVQENRHGTFMFHIKNLYLLDRIEDLKKTKIDYFRIDLRDLASRELLLKISQANFNESSFVDLRSNYPREVIRGYFQINKSDVLFKKLKNYRIQRRDENYVGEVVETLKPEYMAIKVMRSSGVRASDKLLFINPEGKEYECSIHFMKNLDHEDISFAENEELILINYMGRVWPKSQVYIV